MCGSVFLRDRALTSRCPTGTGIGRIAAHALRRRHGARARRRRRHRRRHRAEVHQRRTVSRVAAAAAGGQRLARQSRQAREDAAARLALEVAFAGHAAVVLAGRIVQHDPGPVAGRKVRFADVGNVSGALASHPDALADDEAVGVGCEDDALICGGDGFGTGAVSELRQKACDLVTRVDASLVRETNVNTRFTVCKTTSEWNKY